MEINNENIGLYHPQLMNREVIAKVLNTNLSNRVKAVGHLFDLYSSKFSIVILIEPEIVSVNYNPLLVETFIDSVQKPIIVVPFYIRDSDKNRNNLLFTSNNPKPIEIVEKIKAIERSLVN